MSIDFTEILYYIDDSFQELDKQKNSMTQNNNKSGPKKILNRSELICKPLDLI